MKLYFDLKIENHEKVVLKISPLHLKIKSKIDNNILHLS